MIRGTLTNRETGAKLEGDMSYEGLTTFHFKIDGTQTANGFHRGEWDFEPEVKPLPRNNHVLLADGRYPMVCLSGKWYQVWSGPRFREVSEAEIRAGVANGGRIFDSNGVEVTL